MQSLDSSCQEADFIINDTLKKLKGSSPSINSNSNSTNAALSSLNPSGGGSSILRHQHPHQQLIYQHQHPPINQQQTKQQPQYSHYQHLQTALQCPTPSQQPQQLSTSPPPPAPLSSVTFSTKSSLLDSSLLHCNITQIPSQPPYCIFDDGTESPSEVPPAEILATSSSSSSVGGGGGGINNTSGLDGIPLLAESATTTKTHGTGTSAAPSPSSCSSSTNLSNFNSITSPSPVVPDLLLSTPPGVNASSSLGNDTSVNIGYGSLGTSAFLTSLTQSSQFSTTTATHQSNNNYITITSNTNNNKKADKRPSASLSTQQQQQHSNHSHHHQHHYLQSSTHHHHHPPQHLLSASSPLANAVTTSSSPTSSPSKRQKISKDATTRLSPSTASARSLTSKRDSSASGTVGATTTATCGNSAATSSAGTNKFFNIHDKIRETYLQLLANDLNSFSETGLKQRSRAFVLERLVESEKLNTIVVNLYPGNKGYSLALHYDERQLLTSNGELLHGSDGSVIGSSISGTESLLVGVGSSSSGTNTYRGASSRNTASSSNGGSGSSNKMSSASIPPDLKGGSELENTTELKLKATGRQPADDNSLLQHEYALIEVLRWPYENDQLLQCIDREIIPDFLIDMLNAPSLTLNASHDDNEPARTYAKPNVFYAGCVIAQIRDFRQTFAISTNICDTKHVLLRPTNATIFSDVQHLASTTNLSISPTIPSSLGVALCGAEDKLQLESQLVLATAEPLCLDPDPNVGRFAINAQNARQLFNTHEMRRQMKKYTQISINRKRKLDQFTHHYGLELCDYLTRLRSRPRTNNNANTNAAGTSTAPNSNPLVSAMLTSFSSKVPRRPRDVIRPIRPPRLEYPANLKVPEHIIGVEKYAKTYERPRETTDCQPQLIEEYVLETEREENAGRRVIYHIKLSIFQRPSNSEYLGELYVDRDYREGERNGESCRFSLGTRIHANRYIQQFTEIFTEEGRKAVKITHLVPGHMPKVTHTGITPEQRQALLLQQRQALLAAQQQQQHLQHAATASTVNAPHITSTAASGGQQQQQHVVLVGPNGQQQHILPATVQHINAVGLQQQVAQQQQQPQQQSHISISTAGGNLPKNINIVGLTASNAAAVQQVLRQQHLQQQQQQITTQFLDANGATMHVQTNSSGGGAGIVHTQQQQQTTQHIQLHAVGGGPGSGGGGVGVGNAHTTQLSLSNGSLVLVQQHPITQSQQQQQTLQHAGITIQPANVQQQQPQPQQKTQVITAAQLSAVGANSALRTQLSSSVPILQAQLKAAPLLTAQQQQQLLHKTAQQQPQQSTASSNNSSNSSTTLHTNPEINAIFTNIMNSANQFQQQKQQQQQQQQQQLQQNSNNSACGSNSNSNVKNSSNASIRSLLNSAPAAMTSTPVASGTFTTSTGQHQTVTLVQHTPSTPQQQQQQQQQQTIVSGDSFVQVTTQPTTVSGATTTVHQRKPTSNEVLQNLLTTNRKFNIVTSGGNIVTASSGGTTFRTAAGNLVAVNLNQAAQHQNQTDGSQSSVQQQSTGTQVPQTHQTVRVSMSALASQLASPPAIMTNPNSANFGYTVNTLGAGGTLNAVGSSSGGSIKILNSGVQQSRKAMANALRRDSSNSGAPPNAIVVGVAAPSPGSDSNASNASGFAMPQLTSATNSVGTATSLTLLGGATPSPSGSDHSQSSQTQNQALLERLHNNTAAVATAIPNMSPQQQQQQPQHAHTQYLAKTLVQSPAAATSIHSPMSSPHPQPSPSPHHHQHQQQQQQQQQHQSTASNTTTTTLNLQGINLLQGAIANFPGLQNVQVQIPGLAQPLSLQLPSAVQQQQQQQQHQQQTQTNTATVSCVVSGGGSTSSGNSIVTGGISGQQQHLQQRSLLVSVPVSTHNQQHQQSNQQQHTITLQATTGTQQTQNHVPHGVPPTGTIVNLPSGGTATTAGTQTVVLTNTAGGGGGTGVGNVGNSAGGTGTTTMLTLPIAQLVGPGVQKLNPQTIRTSSGGGGGVAGGSIVLQQQQQQQQGHQTQQQTTTTINVSGVAAGSGGIGGGGSGGGIVNTGQQTAIQLVGTIQQRPRNIVVGTKQLTAAQRQLIATQRNIGGSTLKIATTPINASNANTITTTTNLTATPIVMSTQKLQLKTIKAPQQQQQHARILNQVTATAASQTQTTHPQQQQQQQQQQTIIIGQHVASAQAPHQTQQQQHIQVGGRTVTTTSNANLNQQLISAIAKAAKQQQQQAANRRRSATDVNK